MRDLKLRYFIELASNIGAKARADARTVEAAQNTMQAAVKKTAGATDKLDASLARMGTSRAAERQTMYMRRLGQGIDQTTAKARSLAQMLQSGIPKAAGIAGGVAGGFFAAKTLLDKPMDYSLLLARMTNTAFDDRDTKGRIAGKAELNAAIELAIKGGNGSRDDAAAALDNMIASGVVKVDDAKKLLPGLMRNATASGAPAKDLSSIAIRASQTMGIPMADVLDVLDEANAAGKAGGFELRDMAKSLPAAMAGAKQSGLTGREGFRKIIAMLQASVITAGTKDEAANNVLNWLGKINSDDTAKDFKKQGIDLRGRLVAGRAKGMDSADTFVSLVDEVASKDKQYTALKAKLAKAKNQGEKDETLSSMADILQGKAIGAVVQDRQALMSLVAVMNNRAYVSEIQQTMRDGKGSLEKDHAIIADESSTRATELANNRDIAMSKVFGDAGPLKALLDGANWAAEKFPILTATVVGSTAALGVFTTALLAFGVLGGRNAGGLPTRGGPGGGLPRGGGSPGAFTGLGGLGNGVAAAAPVLGAGAVAAGVAGGLLVVGAPILAAGVVLSNRANSREGLSDRIAARSSRIGELSQLESLGGSPAALARIAAERASLMQDRDTLAARQNALGGGGSGVRGAGFNDPRLLTLTSPNAAEQALAAGSTTKVELGKGELAIGLRITDERTIATTSVIVPMAGIKINAGATNPAGTD